MIQESNRIELKKELTDTLEREVVAFLNSKEGGEIYIGIDDNVKIVGVENIDQTQLKVKDRIKNNIAPSVMGLFDVIVTEIENTKIIKITIASGSEPPYYIRKLGMSSKGCFIRIGSSAEAMEQRIIEDLFSKRTRNSISKIDSPGDDLSFQQLKIYYQEKKKVLNDNFASNLELLTPNKKFSYVAYLLADENRNSIIVAKYSGKNKVDLVENKEFGYCSLIKSTLQVLEKLNIENRTFAKITNKTRIERDLMNPVALREAVINAIVHNDYSTDLAPRFEIFEDRIEITSAGGLPLGFTKEEFFSGYSRPRNKELMRIFKDLEIVEYLGSGIPRILEFYSKDNFIITDNFIRIVLPFDKEDPNKHPIKDPNKDPNKNINLTEEKIIDEISKNKHITIKELSNIIGIHERNIRKNIEKLKNKGMIERKGSRKTGYWVILG